MRVVSAFFGALFMLLSCSCQKQDVEIQHKVSGIVESSKGNAAVINGKLYHVGDFFADIGEISDIKLDGVTISHHGAKMVLQVSNHGGATKVSDLEEKTAKNKVIKLFKKG